MHLNNKNEQASKKKKKTSNKINHIIFRAFTTCR